MTVEKLTEIAETLRRVDWSKKSSILIGSTLNFVGVSGIGAGLSTMDLHPSASFFLLAMATVEAIIIALSIFHRVRVYDPKVTSIGFAYHVDQESEKFYEEIKVSVQRYINAHSLVDVVKIKPIPSDVHFSDDQQAEKYLSDKGLRVLVWGETIRATVADKPLSVFNTRISYQHAAMDEKSRSLFNSMIGSGIRRGVWAVADTESLKGLVVVGGNVTEISLYALATCLLSTRQIDSVEKGTKILEDLSESLSQRNQDANFPNLGDFKVSLSNILYGQYYQLSLYYLLDKKNPAMAANWSAKGITLRPQDFGMNILAARICWELGDQAGAHRYTNAARIIAPKEKLPYLNLAFFHYYNDKPAKGLAIYKRLNDKVYATNIVETIEFIEKEHDKTGKLSLMFAAGWLCYHFTDKTRGKELLNNFIIRADKDNNLAKLAAEAERLLAQEEGI